MEKEPNATSPRSSYGAGGKLRKPSSRKPPSTPYARPTPPPAQQNESGWLSKLVSPAYRLISARILPSFFTKSQEDVELQQDAYVVGKDTPDLGTSRSTENAGPSRLEEPISQPEPDYQSPEELAANSEDAFSRIEQLVQGRRFSREELNHLTEILNSRAAGPSDVEPGKKNRVMENSQEAAETHVAYEIPKILAEKRQDDFSKAIWGTTIPFRRETIQEEVGASPVDIARAYMGGQRSELSLASRSITENDERFVQRKHDFPSMPIIATPSKSSIRWPGVVVQDNQGYLTPQNQKTKFGLHNFPRTPYSKTIYSKSKSKISYLHSDRYKNVNSLQRSQTPTYQQMTRSESLDDGYGSIGPIRRSRQNIAAESPYRGSDSLQKYEKQISHVENADVSGRETPLFKMREPGSTSRNLISQTRDSNPRGFDLRVGVHPQSSQIARRILDQIDRKVPTVQEKAAELRIANSWKKPISSGVSATMPMENVGSAHSNGFGFYKNSSTNDQVRFSQKNGDEGIPPSRVSDSAQINYAAEANYTSSGFANHDNGGPSLLFGKTSERRATAASEKAFDDHQQRSEYALLTGYGKANGLDISETVSGRSATDALGLQKKQQSQPFGNKPVLASLSVDRQQPKGVALSGNKSSTGFTFPVTTSSGVFSEPPTPSVMPSSSAAVSKQSTELTDDVPTYTFGSKRSAPALVFSFPSSSDASTEVDDSEISFTFGSDTKNRISFSSVGKSAVFY